MKRAFVTQAALAIEKTISVSMGRKAIQTNPEIHILPLDHVSLSIDWKDEMNVQDLERQ